MTWGVALMYGAYAAAIYGAGQTAVTATQAKTSAKHGKERAIGRAREIADREASEARLEKTTTAKEKRKRLTGVNRNLNVFGSSIGDQAKSASKILTGQ